ncbi:sperm flagellar protein 2-like [Perognathus longimembris pacificus]|uniref:sperm flagellar protein 2-like n=1 Tax=Perognathus longimembris pacificus TaxID=214514 RepID=UPI0020185AE7|nr:sperm flagellar protein 2-like [Perognathus longimembris pacificus]
MVNAINEIPMHCGWVLDGFPMTLNQAQLLEEALTGYNRSLIEAEGKKTQIPTLAVDPTTSKEVPPPSSAFDFVLLLDISDTSSLNRLAEDISREISQEDIGQPGAIETHKEGDQNLKDQIQHRIIGFLDNWPSLERWFSEPENVLIKINAEIDKESLCQNVKEIFAVEIDKKKNKVEKKLEEKKLEAEKKEALTVSEPPSLTPQQPEPEKEKEVHHPQDTSKSPPGKGKLQSGD